MTNDCRYIKIKSFLTKKGYEIKSYSRLNEWKCKINSCEFDIEILYDALMHYKHFKSFTNIGLAGFYLDYIDDTTSYPIK